MAASEDWDRLAEATRERRVELGMTQEDVRAAGGPSTATMRLIEGALQRSYQPATLRDLEKALRWERGSAARLLGGEPAPLQVEAESVRGGPLPAAFPLPKPTPEMARRLLPLLAEAEGRVKVAQDTHPGQRLTGHQVYPDLPEGEAFWDEAVAAGFMSEHMPAVVATLLAWYAELAEIRGRQDGHAAGLSRRHLVRAVR